jgi:hypothetical protein
LKKSYFKHKYISGTTSKYLVSLTCFVTVDFGTTRYIIRCTACIQYAKLRTYYACQYRLHSYTTCGVGYVYDLFPTKTHTPKSNGSLIASAEPKSLENIHTFTNLLFQRYKKTSPNKSRKIFQTHITTVPFQAPKVALVSLPSQQFVCPLGYYHSLKEINKCGVWVYSMGTMCVRFMKIGQVVQS